MPVNVVNAAPSRAVPPQGNRVYEYYVRFAGDGTLDATRSSQGVSVSSDTGGEYTVTLPGRGGCVIMGATATVQDANGQLIGVLTTKSQTDASRVVVLEHLEEVAGTLVATDLASTEDVFARILVSQL